MSRGCGSGNFSSPKGEVMLGVFLRRFIGDRKGNVAIIFALSIIPCIFLTGMALDFTSATQKRVILNAAADAAALAAVTPTMMGAIDLVAAQTAATNMFNATASSVTGGDQRDADRHRRQQQWRLDPHRHRQLHREVDQFVSKCAGAADRKTKRRGRSRGRRSRPRAPRRISISICCSTIRRRWTSRRRRPASIPWWQIPRPRAAALSPATNPIRRRTISAIPAARTIIRWRKISAW